VIGGAFALGVLVAITGQFFVLVAVVVVLAALGALVRRR